MLTKQETLLGRGAQMESRRVREPRRTALPHGSVSGFMVMRLVSRLSLANQGPSRWRRHCSAKMDANEEGCVPYWDLLL